MDADHIGLSVGDVAGHGLREATFMSQITAAPRNIVPRCGTRPGAALEEVNDRPSGGRRPLCAAEPGSCGPPRQ
ncbi:SpoIIE family protein phosphatase [Streptomyces sp. NPDC028722]|uniref:SpoIIE family protein phosphatase n=1 Tax=Streptomyces sp. NPDC028722 TaxID=3155016 RepID=UPI0033DFF919